MQPIPFDEPLVLYVSPSGTGVGTQASPTNLAYALTTGKDFYILDGVYTQDIVTVLAGVTMQAAPGARPIIVHSDGKAPRVYLNANAIIDGVWFGGAKQTGDRPLTLNNGAKVQNCTFFGYYGCVSEGGNTNHQFLNNRFVNCGSGSFFHDIYISEGHAADGCIIEGNIHIGGEGYKLHLFNGVNSTYPSNVQATGNFYASGQWGQAVYGTSHSITKNIIWSVAQTGSQITATLDANATFDWSQNVIGLNTADRFFGTPSVGRTIDNNCIVDGAPAEVAGDNIGINSHIWQESDIVANLGNSSANIDAAISALESSFAQTVQQIHDDAGIEGNFTTIKNVIDTWKTK